MTLSAAGTRMSVGYRQRLHSTTTVGLHVTMLIAAMPHRTHHHGHHRGAHDREEDGTSAGNAGCHEHDSDNEHRREDRGKGGEVAGEQGDSSYEALLAFGLAALLWRLGRHAPPVLVFAAYLIGSGLFRFLIEFLRTNRPVAFDLTAPQLWSVALVAVGAVLVILARRPRTSDGQKVPLAS